MLEELLPAAPRRGRIAQVGRLGGTRAMLGLERLADRRVTLIETTFRHRPLEELRTLWTAGVRSGIA